ncbi:hypothetical protein [Paenibacillus sp. 22594]|uniref:hypothetical protein n=1 Tax=Paenibacillus sp. 22594 TaxID=3453947 RepID=UPI003F826575
MYTTSSNLPIYDFTTVTTYGILYQGVYYTCSRAIRERWFEKAQRKYAWNIRIKYIPTDMRIIYIHTACEEFEECRVVVRELFEGFELETYL